MVTRMELLKQFVQHLEEERVKLDMTQKQMAQSLDMSLSSYKRLITNNTEKIDLYVIYKLYQLTGKLAYEFTNITNLDLELKKKIKNLSPSQLSFIDSLVDFEASFKPKHENYDDYVTVYIPTGNMEDGMIYDSANVSKLEITAYRKKFGNQISCGIKITSNHLHPVYNKDDILLISRKPIRDGDTGIFINKENGCAYIRKFYQTTPCRLEPINEYGETFFVDSQSAKDMDKWIKFGFVLAKIR